MLWVGSCVLCAYTSFTAFFIQTERSCTRLRSNLCHCRLGWACSTHLAPRPRSEYAHRGLGTARNSPRPVPSGSWRGPSPLPPAQRASTTGGGEPRCCCHPSPPYSPAQRTSPPDVPLSLPPNLCTIRHRGMAHRARPGRCLAGRAQGSPPRPAATRCCPAACVHIQGNPCYGVSSIPAPREVLPRVLELRSPALAGANLCRGVRGISPVQEWDGGRQTGGRWAGRHQE